MSRELLTAPVEPAALRIRPAWRRRLLDWYRAQRRDMPWRGTRDPYRIWVSEVMLQQTQVAVATPFYQTFLARFPTVADLARARTSDVLAAWAGLGYYRRARHLHAAARMVVREHGGRVPSNPQAFGALPGVGPYTAGAVLSIGFDRPLPVLDGNVARVLSRLYALAASVREPRGARVLWALATRLVPMRHPGDWNQALMELGATVCLPRAPRCGACPVRRWCKARALGRVETFPPVVARRPVEWVRRAVVVISRGSRVLMTRREGKLLEGLWEPPGVEVSNGASPRAALRAELGRLGIRARITLSGRVIRHTITHRSIEVEVWTGALVRPMDSSSRLKWVDRSNPAVPVTALGRKLEAGRGRHR